MTMTLSSYTFSRGGYSAAFLFLAASIVLSSAVPAASPSYPAAPSPVRWELGYTGETLGVADGGRGSDWVYRGRLETAADLDFRRIWSDSFPLLLRVNVRTPHGADMGDAEHADLRGTTNIPPYRRPLLHELYLQGNWHDAMLWRVGRLQVDSTFATTRSGDGLLNGHFGWPTFIAANLGGNSPDFDRRAVGVYLRAQTGREVTLHGGLYLGERPDATPTLATPRRGAFAIAELAWEIAPASAIKFGLWHDAGDFADQSRPDRSHRGQGGAYAVIEQWAWREPGSSFEAPQGLTLFSRLGASPADTSMFSETINLGMSYRGLLPQRDADQWSAGISWARVSPDRREQTADEAAEIVAETAYTIVLGRRWDLIPTCQLVRHPGGARGIDDALILGLRAHVTF